MHHFFRNPPMITGIGQSLALIILGSKKRGERRQPVETSTFKNSIHHWLYKCTLQHEIIQCCLKTPKTKPLFSITRRIHGAGIYANIWGILMVNVTIYSIHGSYGSHFNIIPVKLPWHTRLHPIAFGHVWRKLSLHMLRKRHLEFWCLCTLQASDVWLSLTFSMGNSNQFFKTDAGQTLKLNHYWTTITTIFPRLIKLISIEVSFFLSSINPPYLHDRDRDLSILLGGHSEPCPTNKKGQGAKKPWNVRFQIGCISWLLSWLHLMDSKMMKDRFWYR